MQSQNPVQVAALNGSPHRSGNTATLMGWVLEGCQQAGAETEWLHVVDYSIHPCGGCLFCLRSGICCQEDDFQALRDRLLASQGIIVGSPSYSGQPPAQLKAFLDRLTLLNLYTLVFQEKYSIGVATSGFAPCKDLAKRLGLLFGWRIGAVSALVSSVEHGFRPLIEHHPDRLPEEARRLGAHLVATIQQPPRIRIPSREYVVVMLLRRWFLRRQVEKNPDLFAGVWNVWHPRGS